MSLHNLPLPPASRIHVDSRAGTSADQAFIDDARRMAELTDEIEVVRAVSEQADANSKGAVAVAAGVNQAVATANLALALTQAIIRPAYDAVEDAIADGDLATGEYFVVSDVELGTFLFYKKTSVSAAVLQFPFPSFATILAIKSTVDAINEVQTSTAFAVTPPAPSDDYDEVWTDITSPGTRWTTAIVSGQLQITQNHGSLLSRGIRKRAVPLAANLVVYGEAVFDNVYAGAAIQILISPNAGPFNNTTGLTLNWRQDKSVVAYRSDGNTSVAGVIPAGVSTIGYSAGDVVGLMLITGLDATTGTLVQILNGEPVQAMTVTNLVAGNVGIMLRNLGPAAVGRIRSFVTNPYTRKTRVVHLDAGASSDGDGSREFPIKLSPTLARFLYSKPSDELTVVLRPGDYRGGLGIPLVSGVRHLRITSEGARFPRLMGSTLLTGGWTKTSGYTNIYQRAHYYNGVTNSVSTEGGFIQPGRSFTLSDIDANPLPRAGIEAPLTILTRMSPAGTNPTGDHIITLEEQLATLDDNPGGSVVDVNTGIVYIHTPDGVDPNTIELERLDRASVLKIQWRSAAEMNALRVSVEGVEMAYSYTHVFWAQRCAVELYDCLAYGSLVGNAYNFDECMGLLKSCTGQDTFNDVYHMDPVDNLATNRHRPTMTLVGCTAQRAKLGDGISNHAGTKCDVDGYRGLYNGKSGLSQIDTTTLRNSELIGNAQFGYNSGVSYAGQNIEHVLDNVTIHNSPGGVDIGNGATGVAAGTIVRGVMRGGRISNTSGHVQVNRALGISRLSNAQIGDTSLEVYNVRDGGSNGAIAGSPLPVIYNDGDLAGFFPAS